MIDFFFKGESFKVRKHAEILAPRFLISLGLSRTLNKLFLKITYVWVLRMLCQ